MSGRLLPEKPKTLKMFETSKTGSKPEYEIHKKLGETSQLTRIRGYGPDRLNQNNWQPENTDHWDKKKNAVKQQLH